MNQNIINNLISKLVTRRVYLNCQFADNPRVLAHYVEALQMTYVDLGVRGEMDDLHNFISLATTYYQREEKGQQRFYHQDQLIAWDPFEFRRYVEHCLEVHPPKNLTFSPLHFRQWQGRL